MAHCGFCFAIVMCACSNTSAHRVALFSPSASEPAVVSFASMTDQWGQTKQFSDFLLLYFSKCPTFLPVAGLLSSRIRPDCKTLLPDYLLSNTPFTHRGPQTTRGCRFSWCFLVWPVRRIKDFQNSATVTGRKQREKGFTKIRVTSLVSLRRCKFDSNLT